MTCWLVGEAPDRDTVNRPDLWLLPDDSGMPTKANQLLERTGWSIETFLEVFSRRTHVWRVPNPMFPQQGRENAARIARESNGARIVIFGGRAAAAFGLRDEPPFQWMGRYALVPYPSGRCRDWISLEARSRARDFFDTLVGARRGRGSPRRRRVNP